MLLYPLSDLPASVSDYRAVELVYQQQLFLLSQHVSQERNIILRVPKHLFPYLQRVVKKELEAHGLQVHVIDGRREDDTPGTRIQRMVRQFEDAVLSYNPDTVFLLPYIDVLTSSRTGLSAEAREVFTLIHENPRVKLLAFEDPEYPLPDMVEQAFFTSLDFIGTDRKKLPLVITSEEGKRFGWDAVPVMELHRLLGGQSPVQIRRIMRFVAEQPQVGRDDTATVAANLQRVRELTLSGDQHVSAIDLHADIAGYARVKRTLEHEILALIERSREAETEGEAEQIERLVPKGIILHGPPGTGKTLFAQGIANAIQGTVQVVNGPELKSSWVGQGEANIRRLFAQARANAPCVIVFDEIDSIAGKRDGDDAQGGGSARTMVNQLLTEMDGFRPEELVFVVGTTNLPDLLDPALLRPGRFQLKIEIPYPDAADRQEILQLWNHKYRLGLGDDVLQRLANWTSRTTPENTPFAGDHLRSLCQGIKRWVIRERLGSCRWEQVQGWLKQSFHADSGLSQAGISFSDVAGYSSLKERLQRELLKPLAAIQETEDWDSIADFEDILPTGILLEGPPGTGKTHLAAAVAGEWKANLHVVSGPELLSKWVGQSESNLRQLFARAKSNSPSVIVLDEIDAIAGRRDADAQQHGRTTLLQLMTELSELQAQDRVLVIATTNQIDHLDPALLRPGRLGAAWSIDYPDAEDIAEMIRFFAGKYRLDLSAAVFERLESHFQGPTDRDTPHTPDDIRALFQKIKREALGGNSGFLQTTGTFDDWLQSVTGAGSMAMVHMHRIAVHECGHALALLLFERVQMIEEVRLAAAGSSLGYVKHKRSDAPFMTEQDMKIDIAVALGGRAAEHLVFGDGSSGCSQDLEQATHLAQLMVGRLGMGPDAVPQSYGSRDVIDPAFQNVLQPKVQAIIQEQARIIDELFASRLDILKQLADMLLEQKRLSQQQLAEWWEAQ